MWEYISKINLSNFYIMTTRVKNTASIIILILTFNFITCSSTQNKNTEETNTNSKPKIELVRNDAEQRVDVLVDGKLFTAYIYPKSIKKPVLYPLTTARGTKITRGFPLEPMPGERIDHPHHVGMWLNYGDVNGYDFWNNSDSIKVEKRDHYGTIVHKKINKLESGEDKAVLEIEAEWKAPDGETLLVENTTYIFKANENERAIDRITTLTAQDKEILFKDNKEGMLGIRVTRALEHPTDKPQFFTDVHGKPTKVATLNNEGVNGWYYNSEGDEGPDCWGKRAKWTNLTSTIGDEDISLVIFDHPSNVGFPTYWHARTYGLFAANPLGQKIFSKGKEKLNFKLAPQEFVTWKFRVLIVSGSKMDQVTLNKRFEEFTAE